MARKDSPWHGPGHGRPLCSRETASGERARGPGPGLSHCPRTGRAGGSPSHARGRAYSSTAIVGPLTQCQCAMALEMWPFRRPNIGPMALAKLARCRLHESALGQSWAALARLGELPLGSFIETLLRGSFLLGHKMTPQKGNRVEFPSVCCILCILGCYIAYCAHY
jgi:hypothetical protein